MEYGIDMNAEIDHIDKAAYMASTIDMSVLFETESYLKDGSSHTNDSGTWQKDFSESEYEELFTTNSELSNIREEDVDNVCRNGNCRKWDPDEIVIKGDILSSDFINGFSSGLTATGNITDGVSMNDFSMEVAFDKNTYYMKRMVMAFDGELKMKLTKDSSACY